MRRLNVVPLLTRRSGEIKSAVCEAFDRAQSAIVAVATSTVGTLSRLGQNLAQPDEMTVCFGLKFSAQGNVIVTSPPARPGEWVHAAADWPAGRCIVDP